MNLLVVDLRICLLAPGERGEGEADIHLPFSNAKEYIVAHVIFLKANLVFAPGERGEGEAEGRCSRAEDSQQQAPAGHWPGQPAPKIDLRNVHDNKSRSLARLTRTQHILTKLT